MDGTENTLPVTSFPVDKLEERSVRLGGLQGALEQLPPIGPNGPWLAGGAVRRLFCGEDPLASDLDFFFRDGAQADQFVSGLEERKLKKAASKSKSAANFVLELDGKAIPIQVVRIGYYANLAAALDTFDFTVRQFGFDGSTFTASNLGLLDLARKRLVVHKITYAVASVRRMMKYGAQGFTVCNGTIEAILRAVSADESLIGAEVPYVD
ncbi:MAG TPA: hypothetical protein VGK73_08855 [Polyangiaceae bacterium]